jgi:hypothetical protein
LDLSCQEIVASDPQIVFVGTKHRPHIGKPLFIDVVELQNIVQDIVLRMSSSQQFEECWNKQISVATTGVQDRQIGSGPQFDGNSINHFAGTHDGRWFVIAGLVSGFVGVQDGVIIDAEFLKG